MAKRVYANCFLWQSPRFFPRVRLWKAKQTQVEFVELEELIIGKKGGLWSEE